MFFNILRISASNNVLIMFLNIIVSIVCSGVIFHPYKRTGSVKSFMTVFLDNLLSCSVFLPNSSG